MKGDRQRRNAAFPQAVETVFLAQTDRIGEGWTLVKEGTRQNGELSGLSGHRQMPACDFGAIPALLCHVVLVA